MNEIHATLQHLENQRIKNETKEIEKALDCKYKTYEAVRNINKIKPQKSLLNKKDHGQTWEEKKQVKLIAKYFKESFHKDSESMPVLILMSMKIPFTIKEIKSAWAVRTTKFLEKSKSLPS